MLKSFRAFQFGVLVLASSAANATVVDSANIAGLKTFQDINTGRIWLDIDNFFDSTASNGTKGSGMISAAQNAGFTFAFRSDVEQLLNSLPLGNNEWSTYAPIMGYGIPRQLIWGMYDDGNGDPYGWVYAFSTDTAWGYSDNVISANDIPNFGIPGNVDMGIWAYRTSIPTVPVPGAVWLFGSALLGMAGFNQRKQKSA